ncbi:prepilin-type N-terminal cleavage/methylation domain-containing protein [Dethiosulfovibrio peptidovorans]|uniref:prepilin-type N-terminal cleavage/methylation domain-containing protein n=1 Tax=Dethiosulfovibrio peptidovorans TaxID=47055 RepID=UPI00019E4DAE|nr:prepilin-type N-terminal cleavage/methylation domain-containing protein [Dethiosulfovibrio peptidovorans]
MSSDRKKKGFTLLEVIVAVAVLGLVAAGSLKLSITATKALDSVRGESRFLDRIQALEADLLSGKLSDNGEEDGMEWDTSGYSYPLMDGLWRINYRKLDVELDGRTMSFYIP